MQDDDALTEEDKVGSLAGFDEVLGYLDAYSTANARMAAECNWLCMYDKVKAAYNDYLGVYLTKINSVLSTTPTDGGFIPKGVYINSDVTAFFCGMLDGAYIAVKDAGASAWNLGKVASCLNISVFFRDDCKKMVADSWEGVQGMVSLMNPSGLSQVWNAVATEAVKFVDNNTGGEPINRYYNGRTAFEIASMFVGVGAITGSLKAMKAAKLANAIQKVAEISDKLDVTSKIMSKAGFAFKKIGNKTGKFVIRNASGTILGEAFDLVDGVYKNVKKKTSSAYNVFLGTIEGKVEFIGEKTKNVKCKIWGKCSAGAGARIDGTTAECAKEIALEVVEFIKRKKHEGEGVFGRYGQLSAQYSGKKFFDDNGILVSLTAHHIPNDSYMKSLNLPGYSQSKGLCITLESRNGKKYDIDRHSWTETFKSKVDYSHLTPTQVLQRQVNEVIAISLKDGFSDIEIKNIKKELQKLVDMNHELYPNKYRE